MKKKNQRNELKCVLNESIMITNEKRRENEIKAKRPMDFLFHRNSK